MSKSVNSLVDIYIYIHIHTHFVRGLISEFLRCVYVYIYIYQMSRSVNSLVDWLRIVNWFLIQSIVDWFRIESILK